MEPKYSLLGLLFMGLFFISCESPNEPVVLTAQPTIVKGILSNNNVVRYEFNIIIKNNTPSTLKIDGFSAETAGVGPHNNQILIRYDSADINAFGQGGRWEYRNETIKTKSSFSITGAIFSSPLDPVITGTERRIYRFRNEDGKLFTSSVDIKP